MLKNKIKKKKLTPKIQKMKQYKKIYYNNKKYILNNINNISKKPSTKYKTKYNKTNTQNKQTNKLYIINKKQNKK